jgi:hypothetical protein
MNLPIIDFFVYENNDPRTLVVADNSTWKHLVDKPTIIEITLPGYTEPCVTHYFEQGAKNSFNSNTLYSNCVSCKKPSYDYLPDGVYTLTVKGSPDTFQETIKYLKTDAINLELQKQLCKQDVLCFKESPFWEDYEETKKCLELAKAAVVAGQDRQASQLYEMASGTVENLKDKSCKC